MDCCCLSFFCWSIITGRLSWVTPCLCSKTVSTGFRLPGTLSGGGQGQEMEDLKVGFQSHQMPISCFSLLLILFGIQNYQDKCHTNVMTLLSCTFWTKLTSIHSLGDYRLDHCYTKFRSGVEALTRELSLRWNKNFNLRRPWRILFRWLFNTLRSSFPTSISSTLILKHKPSWGQCKPYVYCMCSLVLLVTR